MMSVRLNRIFAEDGRALIVAMDHGLSMGNIPGLENPERIIRLSVAEGADAIMTTTGVVKKCTQALRRVSVIVRADAGGTYLAPQPTGPDLVVSVEQALVLGADALVVMVYPGASGGMEEKSFRNLAHLVGQGMKWGIPVMAEVVPYADFKFERTSPEDIASGVRMAAEAGADFIKTFYTGNVESFRKVVDAAGVPVVVLGGPKVPGEYGLLKMVRDAIDAGASGVAFGRNIWQHRDPAGMVRALRMVVHEGASPEESMESLEMRKGS